MSDHRWIVLLTVPLSDFQVAAMAAGAALSITADMIEHQTQPMCAVCENRYVDAEGLPCPGDPDMARARIDMELAADAASRINDEDDKLTHHPQCLYRTEGALCSCEVGLP